MLSLPDIKRIATGIARDEDPALEVVAAMRAEGASNYAEVVLTRDDGARGPRQWVIGVARTASESDVRGALRDQFRDRLRS